MGSGRKRAAGTFPSSGCRPAVRDAVRFLPVSLLLSLALLSACRGEAGKFKHTGHVTIAKGKCDPCHGADPSSPRTPAASDCTGCHAKGLKLYAEFAALAFSDRIIPHVPKSYGDVKFSHSPHGGAGIPCGKCHALPGNGTGESAFPPMAACKACHELNGVPADCAACHKTQREAPASQGLRVR
jgi:hypothetical protein